ncbi:E3 ubiquitin-protein ligase BRE1-like 2 [Rhynchospora pubera]|uniref:E3 ubiquitin protein ligase n=1 Tax=Rhynchospora pubera TaxID=906938 RepID=A0AAV8FHL9_9POAL|nr:E3 ubiquitin-protein ligase BRE1-like 2 [Rhynchospora pubera]
MASGKRENDAASNGLPDQKEQVDAVALQHQNQKLVQQLEAQKAEMHALEGKFEELRNVQSSYDLAMISLNKMWNQLVNDLVFIGVLAGQGVDSLEALNHEELSADELESCPSEEIFLLRLLKSGPVDKIVASEPVKYAKEALSLRQSVIMDLMRNLQVNIDALWSRNECLKSALNSKLSPEDALVQLENHNEYIRGVLTNMNDVMDLLHQRHKSYTDEIEANSGINLTDVSEIKRLRGDLEESMADLEESRRKLAVLQMKKHGTSVFNVPSVTCMVNGNVLPDRSSDSNNDNKSMGWKELKEAVDEAKALATNRLFELHEAQEDNLILSKQLEDLQEQLKDEKYVTSSKLYILLEDRRRHINTELERFKGLVNSLQSEKGLLLQREKDLNAKSELSDNLKVSISKYECRIEELEHQIKDFVIERNELEMKLEDTLQDSGKKDFKDEIGVMASALTKEMEMLENQLNKYKAAASESSSLRDEAVSLKIKLGQKVDEHRTLSHRYTGQEIEIKSLKSLIEDLEKEKQVAQIMLDMYSQERFESSRTVEEMTESENRAIQQAEVLRNSLEENNLELRVKAAKEAEVACKLRLSTAEAGITDLRVQLDASERDVMELREAIKIKDAEGEAYISEIETIGQAYEDMQTQNQHLLQLVASRDDYNIKLVSDSVKMKQTHGSLLSEKQLLIKQLQQVSTSIEPCKSKITRGEEQMKASMAQANKTLSETRHLALSLEKTMLELSNAEKELKWLRSFVGSSQKDYEQNQKRVSELRLELEQERIDRKKLEEELEEVRSELAELSLENEEATMKKLEEEVKECKAVLKCGVCFDRPKEVVITKCFHLFCSTCIQRNLELRHRKCPGCGTPFGQNDVREVKI